MRIGSVALVLAVAVAAAQAAEGPAAHHAAIVVDGRIDVPSAMLDVGGVRIYAVHDIARLDIDPPAAGVDVVVFGHSHRPGIEHRDRVMYLNPGSAGPRRFDLPVTIARLTIKDGGAEAEIIEILPSA